jgi:hypothetical protein
LFQVTSSILHDFIVFHRSFVTYHSTAIGGHRLSTLCKMLDCARPAPFSRTELVRQSCVPLYQCRGNVLHSLVCLCSPSPGLASSRLMLASSSLQPRFIPALASFIFASSSSIHPCCISLQISSLHLASSRFVSLHIASSASCSLHPRFILASFSLHLRFILASSSLHSRFILPLRFISLRPRGISLHIF